jgi:hypothetical protein
MSKFRSSVSHAFLHEVNPLHIVSQTYRPWLVQALKHPASSLTRLGQYTFNLPPQNNHGSPTLFLCFQQYLPCTTLALHKSIEVTPTCQWTVTFAWFAWNYLHKPLQKVTPTSLPIVNAAQTLTNYIYIDTKLPKQNVNASHPDGKILFVFQR